MKIIFSLALCIISIGIPLLAAAAGEEKGFIPDPDNNRFLNLEGEEYSVIGVIESETEIYFEMCMNGEGHEIDILQRHYRDPESGKCRSFFP